MAYFPTWKGGPRMERIRQYFHLDMASMLEADPYVLNWSSDVRPELVEYSDGKMREFRHTFRAETRSGVRLIRLRGDDGHRGRKKGDAAHAIGQPGLWCETYTRNELLRHPRLGTCREILFHRPRPRASELVDRIVVLAAREHAATLGQLHHHLGTSEVPFEDVLSLVAQGFIEVDLDAVVGPEMPILTCSAKGYLP